MFKKVLANKKAAAFDLDGTIVNSKPYWLTAMNLTATKYGITEVDIAPLMHLNIPHVWETILLNNKPNPVKSVQELTEETYTLFLSLSQKAAMEYMDGLPETMAVLRVKKNFKTVLTTNTVQKVADKMLEIMDVAFYFDAFIYGDDLKHIKPDPEIYIKAAKKLGVKTSEMLVFEDSVEGVESAVKAGCDVIVIWNGLIPQDFYPNSSRVKAFIVDFTEFWANADVDIEEEALLGLEKSAQRAREALAKEEAESKQQQPRQ